MRKLYSLREIWGHFHVDTANLDAFIRKQGQTAQYLHIGADQADRHAHYAVFRLKEDSLLVLTVQDLENIGQRLRDGEFPSEVMANMRTQLGQAAGGFQANAKLGYPAVAGPLPAHYRLAFSA